MVHIGGSTSPRAAKETNKHDAKRRQEYHKRCRHCQAHFLASEGMYDYTRPIRLTHEESVKQIRTTYHGL